MILQGSGGTIQPWLRMNTAAIWVTTIAKKSLAFGYGGHLLQVAGTSLSAAVDDPSDEECRPVTADQSSE
jgi:hypothetical protein